MKALILAGGKGRRLRPYTTIMPKPLMPIGDKAILEIILHQLTSYGFKEIIISIGHLGELIMSYFGDGSKYKVKITYIKEEKPLGTAGPLSLAKDYINGSFLMINGDILTDINFSELMDYHIKRKNIATIALNKRVVNIDFGVTEVNQNNEIVGYKEKPTLDYLVSMGIYLFNERVLDYIEDDKYFDIPELINRLIKNDETIDSYLFDGYWLDIGRPDDYEKANTEFADMYNQLLG
jgi:NDP-mannose synthase